MIGGVTIALLAIAFNPAWPPNDPDLPVDAFQRPQLMPDDPEYAPVEANDKCLGQHELYSFVPDCAVNISEDERNRAVGVGIHVDRAWAWTTGRPDVAIAVLADGVDWTDTETVSRWRLSPGELPPPATSSVASTVYDVNGDGLFNVQDYTTASGTVAPTIDRVIDRVLIARADGGDLNGNGLLDPQDLIGVFSDGVDTDGNGYVDDISGWDHLEDDNDPGVVVGASPHARWIAASANNGIGGAGACPSCALLPMRVGRDGLSHAHVVALAVIYAVDEGASVIAAFTSAIEATSFFDDAIAYAFGRGRLIVAGVGNASSRIRRVPWNPDRVLIVGGVGYDAFNNREATTAMAPDSCSSFGPQLAAVGPGRCDDRGAAVVAGAAGLLYSASLGLPERGVPPVDPPLSASEALQILVTTADDAVATDSVLVASDEVAAEASLTTRPRRGWDERTGYGRINARRAVDAIVRRRIPPWAEITSPRWYEMTDPLRRDSVFVTATIVNPRHERVTWTLTAAPGLEPEADALVPVESGTLEAGEVAEIEGVVFTAGLFKDTAAPPDAYGDFAITLRLVTRTSVGGDVVTGEARRVFFVHRDLDLLPAFPIWLGSGVVASPRIVDLDNDGDLEIVVATVDGMLRAVDIRGEFIDAFDVRTSPSPLVRRHLKAPAFADNAVRANVPQTIVAAPSTEDGLLVAQTTEGALIAVDKDGNVSTVFTSSTAIGARRPGGFTSAPVLFDLDGDGKTDVITEGPDTLRAHHIDGTPLNGWPVAIEGDAGTPSVGDVDGNGVMDVVATTAQRVYAVGADGRVSTEWPKRLPAPVVQAPASIFLPSAALGDIDNDGQTDIAIAIAGAPALLLDSGARTVNTGRDVRAGSDLIREGPPLVCATNHVTLANLMRREVASTIATVASADTVQGLGPEALPETALAAFEASGQHEPGFPRRSFDLAPLDALVVDLDGDRRAEIVVGEKADRLRVIAFDGSRPRGYPKFTSDEVVSTPTVEDLDGDGLLELVAVTRSGQLFVWRTRGPSDGRVRWNGYHHDRRATGNLDMPTFVREKVETSGGCACDAAPGRSDWLGVGLLLLAAIVRLSRRG